MAISRIQSPKAKNSAAARRRRLTQPRPPAPRAAAACRRPAARRRRTPTTAAPPSRQKPPRRLSLRPKATIKPQINIVDYPPAPPDPADFSADYDAAEAAANAPRLLTKDEEVAPRRSAQRLRRLEDVRSALAHGTGGPRSSYQTPSGPRRWVWTLST